MLVADVLDVIVPDKLPKLYVKVWVKLPLARFMITVAVLPMFASVHVTVDFLGMVLIAAVPLTVYPPLGSDDAAELLK